MEDFSVEYRQTPLADIIRIVGEADVYVAPELRAAFNQAVAGSPSAVVVDLTATTFLDSTGLSLLLRLRERLGETPLLLVSESLPVTRLFEITALDRRFKIVPSLSDALRRIMDAEPAPAA